MKNTKYLVLITSIALLAGCASMPPKELSNARAAYQQASEGPALRLAPAELHIAQGALAQAEESFQKEPNSYRTKDLAYVATRKAELAGSVGAMAANKATKDSANTAFQNKQTEIVKQGKEDLIASEKKGKDDLLASEQRTAEAMAALAKLAAVKEEERGLVITLSGSVLFRSNETTLLSSAQVRLDQVGEALLAVRTRNLVVEGHTDSRGTGAYNQDLSQRRAEAVRNYLVQKGYPADRIVARGMGMGSPIANNASPEGRANNRRVEIVIEREMTASK